MIDKHRYRSGVTLIAESDESAESTESAPMQY